MPKALTPAVVSSAICPQNKLQIDIFDTVLPGLSLRVGRAGKKTWSLLRRIDGKRVRVTLGPAATMSLAEARAAVRAILSNSPSRRPPALAGPTVDNLLDAYRQRLHNIRPSTHAQYERYIERIILPAWRGRLVASLTRQDIFDLTDPIMRRGAPMAANRVQILIGSILRVAVDRGWVASNIATGIRAPGGPDQRRERVLSLADAATLWLALDRERNPDNRDVLRLALLLGQRKGELTHMAWDELDFGTLTWTIPADRAKNKRTHVVPLSTTAVSILEARMPGPQLIGAKVLRLKSDARVFPRVTSALSHLMKRYSKHLAWRENATVHDLRRTCATMLATGGTPRHILKSILGHADLDVTAIYDRAHYSVEKAQAVQAWDDLLMAELAKITPRYA